MTPRLLDLAETVLIVVSTFVAASMAAALPFVGVPVAAMALGRLAYKRGLAWAAVLAAVAAVAAPLVTGALAGAGVAGGWREIVFTLPALLVAGPGTAWAIMRWPGLRTIAIVTGALIGAAVLYQTLVGLGQGHSFLDMQRLEATQAGSIMVGLLRATGETDATALAKAGEEYARTTFLLWPSSLAYTYLLAAALAVPVVSRMGRMLGRAVNRLPALADIDMSLHVVWPAIAGLALIAAATFMRQPTGIVWAIGINLLLLARAPLFVQGLGDFAALYRKANVGRFGRVFGFTFLTLSEAVIPFVSVVGLLDIFANLRRLPRGGSGARPGLESGRGRV